MTPAPLGWLGIIRLGLVQTALGAIVVLTTSALNRVMVVELALPATLPGILVGIHYALQMLRPRMGYGSDMGGRRTPWIIGGMAVLALGGVLAAAGTALVMFPMLVTWVTDAAAFFVGRAVGGPKLMPSVSPGKTISGAIGGLFGGAVTAWAYAAYVLPPATRMGMTLWAAIASGVLLSVVAQIGDLVESLLKRQAGVKDSSHLIPGHGGVLDRTDSLLFTLPVGFVLLDRLLSLGA